MALTGRTGLLALLATVVVAIAGRPLTALIVLDGALLGAVVVDLAFAAGVRQLQLHREGDTSARLGEQASVALSITNSGKRTARLVLREAWAPSAGATPSRHRLRLASGRRAELVTTLTPTRRGDRVAGRITVRSLGPLGLAGRQGRHAASWRVRVLPPFPSRRLLPGKLAALRQVEGVITARGRGQGSEFDSLRDYVVGDDVRAIDWRGTARLSSLVVRSYRPERDRRVVLVLDTGRTSAGRVGNQPRLDHAMDAALLLAALATRAGDRVDLLAHDRVTRCWVSGGRQPAEVLARLIKGMTPLTPELIETDYRALTAALLTRVRQRSLIVLCTDLNAAVVEESLIPALPVLARRHAVVLAALGDPVLDAMTNDRTDVAAAYGAAAAEQALAERRRLARLLLRRGVEVIDAPPARYASAVADAYLAMKAAGRL